MKDKLEKTDILEFAIKKTHPHFKSKINISVDNMILLIKGIHLHIERYITCW